MLRSYEALNRHDFLYGDFLALVLGDLVLSEMPFPRLLADGNVVQ